MKPGGRLVYCVCTPLPREGVKIVEAFLADHAEWQRKPSHGLKDEAFANCVTEEGDFLTLPHLFDHPAGCDAFYISCLEKRAD